MVQFDDIIFFGWVDTNYIVGSVPAASVGNAVFTCEQEFFLEKTGYSLAQVQVGRLGCEQLHKPWMLMSQHNLRSSYPTYPFPISLDFVACRVLRKHPSLRVAKSIFSVGETDIYIDVQQANALTTAMNTLCMAFAVFTGWVADVQLGRFMCLWQHQLWSGVLKMAMKRFWRWAEYDIEMSWNFSAHKLRFLGERIKKLCDLHLPK